MKDISARTDTPGVEPTVFLDITVNDLEATINMTTGDFTIEVYDDDGNGHDITSGVTGEYNNTITHLGGFDMLREEMEEWEPPEPDFDFLRPEPELYHGPRNFPEY